jgi:hypothetical protein
MRRKGKAIPEIDDLLGKKMHYKKGRQLKDELEARYGVRIKYYEHTPVTSSPDKMEIIFSDYEYL